jgi:cellobiose-specific phosphotransferase system component IIA
MKRILAVIAIAALSGCGLDTLGAAASSAALKKQQLEQGKKTMEQAQQQLDQALELQQKRAEPAADGADK